MKTSSRIGFRLGWIATKKINNTSNCSKGNFGYPIFMPN